MAKKSNNTVEQVENASGELLEGATPETATVKTPKTPKAPKPVAPKVEKKIFYLLGREATKDDKMATQCNIVFQHIQVHCGQYGKADRKALIAGITPEELKTRQGVDRIVAYYIPALIKAGLISKEVDVEEVAPTVVE